MKTKYQVFRFLKCRIFAAALCAFVNPVGASAETPVHTPSTVRDAGVLRIATYVGFPPFEFVKDGQVVGAEIELGDAIAKKMGVKASFANVPFEGIIAGLLSERYDLALSNMSDTERRRSQVDFVDYAKGFTSIVVQKGNPKNVHSLGDLCGLPVATQQGSMQEKILTEQSTQCVSQGKSRLDIARFPSQAQVSLDLKSGRSAAEVRDYALGVYEVSQSEGKLELVSVDGKPAMVGLPDTSGIAVRKGDTEMARSIQQALQALKADGTYDRIFTKWGVEYGAISEFAVNSGKN